MILASYLDYLKTSGNVPRTVANYANFLKIFFNHNKIAWPLEKTDRVTYTGSSVHLVILSSAIAWV